MHIFLKVEKKKKNPGAVPMCLSCERRPDSAAQAGAECAGALAPCPGYPVLSGGFTEPPAPSRGSSCRPRDRPHHREGRSTEHCRCLNLPGFVQHTHTSTSRQRQDPSASGQPTASRGSLRPPGLPKDSSQRWQVVGVDLNSPVVPSPGVTG